MKEVKGESVGQGHCEVTLEVNSLTLFLFRAHLRQVWASCDKCSVGYEQKEVLESADNEKKNHWKNTAL